jgi:hypothetical protein
MNAERFIEKIRMYSFQSDSIGELDIKRDVDLFCLAIQDGEAKIELLKNLRKIIDEKIKEIENEIDYWKKKVANQIDGKIEGNVFTIFPRMIKQFSEDDIEKFAIKKFVFVIKTNDWEKVAMLENFLNENNIPFQKKDEIDVKETKELLEKLGKVAEIKTLVIKTTK